MTGEVDMAAYARLLEEWPDILGRIVILAFQEENPFQPLKPDALEPMSMWTTDVGRWLPDHIPPPAERAVGGIMIFLNDYFRLDRHVGALPQPHGTPETAIYTLVYLCQRPELAWYILRIFVPLLRPELWDEEFRAHLEFDFFEYAWEATFDFDDLEEPTDDEDFDWPGRLNELDAAGRQKMLDYAGLPPLPDPRRPEVAPWNRVFDLGWLWADGYEPPGDPREERAELSKELAELSKEFAELSEDS